MTEETLFHEVLAKPPSERAPFLAAACVGNPELRAAVEALLVAHEQSNLLDQPAVEATVDHQPRPAHPGATGAFLPARPTDPGATAEFLLSANPQATLPEVGVGRGPITAGTILSGRYTLVEKLGEGGMGEVWVAQQTEPVKRRVALKLIKTGVDSRGVLARFEQERQALAIMDHPHIARVLDGGATPTGQPFFVMELVNGLPLTRFCDEARLSPRERLELFVPICQAVQHAHQKGIVHRDLKPANILVTLIDGKPVPKVIDFGVAKATGGELVEEAMTQFGAVIGTLEYMAPEQAGYSGVDIDTRADIYSLGVILYELLTGLRPIDVKRLRKAGLAEMVRVIQEEEPSKPSTRLSTAEGLGSLAGLRQMEPRRLMGLLRGELDWVVMKCLEKQRDRRYETANGLCRDIQRYLSDEAVEARPPSAGYRLKKMIRRNRVAVLATALVAASLVIGITVAVWQAAVAREAETQERAAKQNAENLATANAKLADDEHDARNRAENLATANAKLADDERDAKNREVAARQERDRQLQRTRAILFTSQLERAGRIYEKDPTQARRLLNDTESCPVDLRDLAWNFIHHASARHQGPQLPFSGFSVVISPDGKWVAGVNTVTKTETQNVPGLPPKQIFKHESATVSIVEVATGKVRATLPKFSESVGSVTFSSDGNGLAVVLYQLPQSIIPDQPRQPEKPGTSPAIPYKIQVWDLAKVKKTVTLEGHADRILAIAFNPDGTRLVTCGRDNVSRIWDPKTGKELHFLKDYGKEVRALAFSPDGKQFATGGMDNQIKLWDVESGQSLASWEPAPNPDTALATYRKQDGPLLDHSFDPRDGIISLDFSPDGRSLVSGNTSWLIEIRDVASGQVRLTVRDLKCAPQWVRYHRDGKSIVTYTLRGRSDQLPARLTQWDATTGELLRIVPDPYLSGSESQFCRAGSFVLFGGKILELDVPLERARFEAEKVEGRDSVAVFSRKGDVLVVGCGNRIFLWDVKTGKLRHTLLGHKNLVYGLAVSPDGRTLVSSSASEIGRSQINAGHDLRLWDINTGESLGTIPVGFSIPSVAFSPDGSALAAVHWVRQKQAENPLKPAPPFGPPGTMLGETLTVAVWDVKTRALRFTREHPNAFNNLLGLDAHRVAVAFNPADGSLVSMGGRSLCIWNPANGELLRQILTGVEGARDFMMNKFVGLAISPDGNAIVTTNAKPTGGEGGMTFTFWDPKTGAQIKQAKSRTVGKFVFSPDGKNLVSTSGSSIEIWDALTLQQRFAFPAHSKGHVGLAISPDGQTLASAVISTDTRLGNFKSEGPVEVKLWDVSRSPAVLTFTPRRLMFGRDRTLIEADLAGVIRLWDLETGGIRAAVDTTGHKICTSGTDGVLSPDGRYIAGHDVIKTGEMQPSPFPGRPYANAMAQVNLLDTTTGTLRAFPVGKGPIEFMTFSPDGTRLALLHRVVVAGRPEVQFTVEIWNAAATRSEVTIPLPNLSGQSGLVFNPDGKTVAVSGVHGTASRPDGSDITGYTLLLDITKGTILTRLNEGPSRHMRTVWFTPDGNRLVVRSAVETGPHSIWDWRAGKKVDEPIPDAPVKSNVSPDGRYELRYADGGVEVIDRTVKPPAVVSQRRVP